MSDRGTATTATLSGRAYSSLEGEIIAAVPPTMKANGQVYTPYSCLAFDITPDGTAATDIEHIVSLAETHDSSIADRRRDIASDLDNLTIADPTVTRSEKSDRDAAEWMPARHGAWFAERVIQVTLEYGLRVDPFLENPAPPSPVHAGDGLVGQEARARQAFKIPHPNWHTLSVWPILAWLPYVDTLLPALRRPRRNPSGSARLHARPPTPARGPWPDP